MIVNDTEGRPVGLETRKIKFELDCSRGLLLKSLQNKSMHADCVLAGSEKELFVLLIEEEELFCSDFTINKVSSAKDKTQEFLVLQLAKAEDGIKVRVCFLINRDDTISFILQVAVNWNNEGPKEVYLQLPFLSTLKFKRGIDPHYFLPLNPVKKQDGSSVVQMHENFPMPLGIVTEGTGPGFCIDFPRMSESWFPYSLWVQNRNIDLNRISTEDELKELKILLRPNHVLTDIVEMNFEAIENGWVDFFNSWREKTRSRLYLSMYDREDLKWYRNIILQHFTFVYGREIYNYESDSIELDRLLSDGTEFGGYDSVLLWHQYPRLGVDHRNQWDFFRDFPKGIDGLSAISDKAHKAGVKVFLPFKPWDIGTQESLDEAAREIGDLVRDSGVDGIFLDTMNSVPEVFRESVDRARPGVVFCSEMHPTRIQNLQMITGGWDQHWNKDAMPEIDLLRYVLPEHIAPITSRWKVGAKKDVLIKRAIFNGTGIVIWQDVFGAWLPFNKMQKVWIKKWKHILKENLNTYNCSRPIPLYPTLKKNLFCNYFKADNGDCAIYSLYNDSETRISGKLLLHHDIELGSAVECWNEIPVKIVSVDNTCFIQGTIEAHDLLVIKLIKEKT